MTGESQKSMILTVTVENELNGGVSVSLSAGWCCGTREADEITAETPRGTSP